MKKKLPNTQEKKTNNQQRLIAYSALAGAVVAIAPLSADAEAVYTDVDPDSTVNLVNLGNFAIDFDGDAVTDMNFFVTAGLASTTGGSAFYVNFAFAYGSGNGQFAGSDLGGVFFFPYAYNAGQSIGPAANWQPVSGYGSMNYLTATTGGAPIYQGGNFENTTDKYLPVRFTAGDGMLHYAWVRVDVGGPNPNNFITIKDYAYEAIADTPIDAGDMVGAPPVGLNEVPSLEGNVNVYSFAGQLNVQVNGTEQPNGAVRLFSTSGSLMAEYKLNSNSESYQLDLNEGLYIVQIRTEEGILNKEVYVSGQ